MFVLALGMPLTAIAQQTPVLIPPNPEQQGIPKVRQEEVLPRTAAQTGHAPAEAAVADQVLPSPVARIDVQSPLLAPQIEATLHPFIGKSRLSGSELAQARGEIWDLLRRHGHMTRVELRAEPAGEGSGGSVLHALIHEVSVRMVLVEQERGTSLGASTLDAIRADAKADIADGGLLDIEGLDSRIRRRLFLRDVDVRAALVPVDVDKVDVKILVASKPHEPISLLLQADNHGMRTYGRNRYTVGISIPRWLTAGDQFDALTINSAHMHYGRLGYEVPITPLGARLDMSGALVTYRAPTGEKGRTYVLGTGLSYPFHLGDRSAWIGQIHYLRRQQTDRLNPLGRIADKTTDSLQSRLDIRYYPSPSQVVYFTPTLTVGDLDLSDLPSALEQDKASARTDGRFVKFEWEAGWNTLFGQDGRFDARIDTTGQLANKNLDQSEKFAPGGPLGLRAFGPAEALGDEGYVVNGELGYHPTQRLRLFSFYGVGRTHRYDDPWVVEPTPNSYTLQAAGIGLSATYGPVAGSLTYAHQVGGNPGRSANGRDSDGLRGGDRLWFTLTFRQ